MARSSPTFSSKLDAAIYFAERGFHVFPLQDNAKVPRSLDEFGSWKALATTDLAQIKSWWARWPDANIGCHPGASGHSVLDVDDKGAKTGSLSLTFLEAEHGELPQTMICGTATGGRHLWFKGAGFNTAGDLGDGLDTRGEGGFLVMPGSEIDGKKYTLFSDTEPAEMPVWLAEKMAAILRNREERKRTDGVEDLDLPADLDRAAQHLDDLVRAGDVAIEGQGGNNRTYKLAQTLRDLGLSAPGAGRLMAKHWNPACAPPWAPEELAAIIDNAYAYGQNEAGVKALGDADGAVFAGLASAKESSYEIVTPPSSNSTSRFRILSETAQDTLPEPSWLIPGWLAHQNTALFYGEPGSYKSFVALHFALSLASGIPIPGIKYPAGWKQSAYPVLYIAGEGASGIARQRRPAWKKAHGIEADIPFFLAAAPPLVRDRASWVAFMGEVEAAMVGVLPRLIVFDTYSRLMPGMNENDAGDTGIAIEMVCGLGQRYSAAGLVVHHENKGGGLRGSSALSGNFDALWHGTRERSDRTMVLTCDKQKDAPEPQAVAYTVEEIEKSIVMRPCAEPLYEAAGPAQLKLDATRVLYDAGAVGYARGLKGHMLAESLLAFWGQTDEDPEIQAEARRRVTKSLMAEVRGALKGLVIPGSAPPIFALPEEAFQLKPTELQPTD